MYVSFVLTIIKGFAKQVTRNEDQAGTQMLQSLATQNDHF